MAVRYPGQTAQTGAAGNYDSLPGSVATAGDDAVLSELPSALLFWLTAVIDPLKLDRRLLRVVALRPAGVAISEIAQALGEPTSTLGPALERAVTGGILYHPEPGMLAFVHPAFKAAVNCLGMDS